MSEEITIHHVDGSVHLGILEEKGRIYYHVRYIPLGATEPEAKAREVPIADVTIEPGFNYQAVLNAESRKLDLLQWQAKRQGVVVEIRERETRGVEVTIAKQIKDWEKNNPAPTRTLADAMPELVEEIRAQTMPTPDGFDVIADAVDEPKVAISTVILDPDCPSCFRSDGTHAEGCETSPWTAETPGTKDCPECGGPYGEHTETCSLNEKDDTVENAQKTAVSKQAIVVIEEGPCQSKYAGAPCTQETGHEHFHTTDKGFEWSNSQADGGTDDLAEEAQKNATAVEEVEPEEDTEEEEEAQESSPVAEGDDPPF